MNRRVGEESSKTYQLFLSNGFFTKYMSGKGLDIGFAGYIPGVEPILPSAVGIDIYYPGYNGDTLPFKDASQDYVYSSHCLEHIIDWKNAIQEWYRVTTVNGYVIITVPHKFLYEKKDKLPSNWNSSHRRFYTPSSLLHEIEQSLESNSYRIRLLEDGDRNFDYSIGPKSHSGGQYEILLVLQKINKPHWNIE